MSVANKKSFSILVVEDNLGDYMLVKEYLRQSEMPASETFHADRMAAVSSIVKDNIFDIALLDLSLPDSTGIDSVKTVLRLLPKTPVVVFSGLSDVETAKEAISLGAQDYLVKGEFDEKLLAKIIHYSIERKKLVETLRQSNERHEYVNKATLDTIWEWDYDTNTGRWGNGFMKTFGYTEKELRYDESWVQQYIHPDDRSRVMEGIISHIKNGHQNWQEQYRFRAADGSYKHVFDRGFLLFKEDGTPYRMIGAMTDITDKIKLEKELAEKELYQQKLITEVTILAQEKERNELGKELHDNINQVLATIKMFLGLSIEKEAMRLDLIRRSLENINYTIEEIRKLSKTLVAPSLGDIGLAEALQELADDINLTQDLRVQLVHNMNSGRAIDRNMELMLYRIAQEQLNNIRKYAKADKAIITLSKEDNRLFFSISDNGIGFDTRKKAQGIGLKNISSRVDFYSGKVNIISAPGQGCTLEINIPV